MSAPRIAIVTGSSQGIGLETCRQLVDQDLHVILTARTPEQIDPGLAALDRSGSVEGEILDVVDLESVEAFFASLLKKHDHLDELVNNAGSIFQTPATDPDEARSAAILNAVDTNTLGAWRMIRNITDHGTKRVWTDRQRFIGHGIAHRNGRRLQCGRHCLGCHPSGRRTQRRVLQGRKTGALVIKTHP